LQESRLADYEREARHLANSSLELIKTNVWDMIAAFDALRRAILHKAAHALLTVFAVLLFLPSSGLAAIKSSKNVKKTSAVTLTPMIGGYLFAGSDDLDPTPLYGLKLSYDIIGSSIIDSLGIEGTVNYFSTTQKGTSGNADGYIFRADALYFITPKRKLVPFIALGAGAISINKESERATDPLINYGIGLKYYWENYLALRVDARQLLVYKDVNTRNNFELSAGLTYVFGQERRKKAPPAKPAEKKKAIPSLEDEKITPPAEVEQESSLLESAGAVGAAVAGALGVPATPVPVVPQAVAGSGSITPEAAVQQPEESRQEMQQAARTERQKPSVVKQMNVEFGFAKVNIEKRYNQQLEALAGVIKGEPTSTVLIEGHTDNIGSYASNLALSERRAKSVKDSLIKLGIDPDRITTKGYAFTKPVVPNKTEAQRQKNRRAVAVISIFTSEAPLPTK